MLLINEEDMFKGTEFYDFKSSQTYPGGRGLTKAHLQSQLCKGMLHAYST